MKKQICLAGVITFLFVLQGCFQSQANSQKPAPKPKGKPGDLWYETNRFQVTITSRNQKSSGAYEFRKNKSDLRLEVNNQADNESDSGTILVIDNVMLLIKGLKTEAGYEIDVLDGNILSVKLAYALLVRAFPKGPDSIGDTLDANLSDRKHEISINTPGASLEISPPWSLKGSAKSSGSDLIEFDLTLTSQSPEAERIKETLHFSGSWYKNSPELELPDDMPLQDWQILPVGPEQFTSNENETIYDFSAGKMMKFATIGELRKALQTGKQRKK